VRTNPEISCAYICVLNKFSFSSICCCRNSEYS